MPKLLCPCGFVHDLSPIPDDGWRTVRDKDFDEFLEAANLQFAFGMDVPDGEQGEKVLEAERTVSAMYGLLYECPQCGRLMWQNRSDPQGRTYRVYKRES